MGYLHALALVSAVAVSALVRHGDLERVFEREKLKVFEALSFVERIAISPKLSTMVMYL